LVIWREVLALHNREATGAIHAAAVIAVYAVA